MPDAGIGAEKSEEIGFVDWSCGTGLGLAIVKHIMQRHGGTYG